MVRGWSVRRKLSIAAVFVMILMIVLQFQACGKVDLGDSLVLAQGQSSSALRQQIENAENQRISEEITAYADSYYKYLIAKKTAIVAFDVQADLSTFSTKSKFTVIDSSVNRANFESSMSGAPLILKNGLNGFSALEFLPANKSVLQIPKNKAISTDQISIWIALNSGASGQILVMESLNADGSLNQEKLEMSLVEQSLRIKKFTEGGVVEAATERFNVESGAMLIMVQVGSAKDEIVVQINGSEVLVNFAYDGSPAPWRKTPRVLALGDSINGSAALIGELVAMGHKSIPAEINQVNRSMAERWGIASYYFDESLPVPEMIEEAPADPMVDPPPEGTGTTPAPVNPNTPKFDQFKMVFSAKCASCHTEWDAISEAVWLTSKAKDGTPLIASKSLQNSTLYLRLKGAKFGDVAKQNMPAGGTLSSSDLQIVEDWILGLP
jgi:hypothetical protein